MAKQKIEVEIDVPERYELIGFRTPLDGECFLSDQDLKSVLCARGDFTTPKFIVRKIKQYRVPTLPEDAVKVCEFSDDQVRWSEGKLVGFYCGDLQWRRDNGTAWKYCRIEVTGESR